MSEQEKLQAYQHTIELHHANYDVFQARTEKDLQDSIKRVLQKSQRFILYYQVVTDGLELLISNEPNKKKSNLGDSAKKIKLLGADIARYFSEDISIVNLENAELPAPLLDIFKSNDFNQIAVIPVVNDVVTLGVLMLGGTDEEQLTEENLDPYVHLAELIPTATENVRAARATQQRLRELEIITETSQSISATNDLNSLYKTLHNRITETIGAINFAIALYDTQTETIEIPFLFERGEVLTVEPFPIGEGLVSILIRTRQPLMILEDAERRAKALGAKIVGEQQIKSWLGCPLVMGNEVIGALILQDFDTENRFTQDDLRFVIALSSQVAGAINNIRLLEIARQRTLQLQTVAEIAREVSGSLIVDNLLREAVELIRSRFNFYHASVFLMDDTQEYAVIREATGDAGIQLKRSGHKLAVGSKSIVGYVTKNKTSLVVNDTSLDPNYYANPLLPETRAEAALPLLVGDRVLGVLDVQSTRPFVFAEENVKTLQILADQLAVALVNSELFAEAQERLSQHRLLHHVTTAAASSTTIEEALNSAVQGLQVTLGGDQISILMADKEQKNLEVKSSIGYPNEESARLKVPFGVGITGWVASHRQAQRINDVTKDSRYISVNSKARSELAIPLIYRNEVLGVLNVESNRVGAYSENDEEMLGTLAGSLAAIIAHSRLLEQFRQQVERERLLYEITSKIRRTTSPEKILAVTAEEISKAIGARRTQVRVGFHTKNETDK